MRIYCAIRHAAQPAHYYSGLWAANFYPSLRRLGHQVIESSVDLEAASHLMQVAADFTAEELSLRAGLTERIVEEVARCHRAGRIDLFLSYFYNCHFDPAGFERVHTLGIPTINFFCNSMYQFELVADVARAVQHSWHPERHAAELYREAGARPVCVQMGAEPDLCRPSGSFARERAVCFVGQRYADRELWLAALARAGIPLRIYGQGWQPNEPSTQPVPSTGPLHPSRPVRRPGSPTAYLAVIRAHVRRYGAWGGVRRTVAQAGYRIRARRARRWLEPLQAGYAKESLADLFSRFEIALNLSNVWSDGQPGARLIPHVRLRDFEVPMSGGCLLTADTDEIRDCFRPGEEIETYLDKDELVDKARFLLDHPDGVARIRAAGKARALRDHTWDARFRELFSRTGLA